MKKMIGLIVLFNSINALATEHVFVKADYLSNGIVFIQYNNDDITKCNKEMSDNKKTLPRIMDMRSGRFITIGVKTCYKDNVVDLEVENPRKNGDWYVAKDNISLAECKNILNNGMVHNIRCTKTTNSGK